MNLSKEAKITRVLNAQAAGTSDISNGTVIDMLGFDGALFMVSFGAITSGAVTSVKIQGSANSDGSSASDITGASVTVADTDDNKIASIDVVRPQYRYLVLYVDRGTQNAVIDSATCIQYDTRKKPVTHDTSVVGAAVTFVTG